MAEDKAAGPRSPRETGQTTTRRRKGNTGRRKLLRMVKAIRGATDLPTFLVEPVTCPGCGGSIRRLAAASVYMPFTGRCVVVIPFCARCDAAHRAGGAAQARIGKRVENTAELHIAAMGLGGER